MFKDYSKTLPCKIGTIPAVVLVHGKDLHKIEPKNYIRIKEKDGDKWHYVLVNRVDEDGHFQADRM